MSLEGITLSEMSQTVKDGKGVISHVCEIENKKETNEQM